MKNLIKYSFLFFVLLSIIGEVKIPAQNKKIDSLKIVLKNAKHDTTRCNILKTLIEISEEEEIKSLNLQLKLIAEKHLLNSEPYNKVYKKHLAAAYVNDGNIEKLKGEVTIALDYFKKSLRLNEEIGNKIEIANALGEIGSLYDDHGDIPKALEYYSQSLKICEELGNKYGIACLLNNLGRIYKVQNDLKKALEYYNKSLILLEETSDKRSIATSLSNIGSIYLQQLNFTKALEYQLKGLKLREEIGNKRGIATSLNNIAIIYFEEQRYSEAKDNYFKSLGYYEEINDVSNIAMVLNNIAILKLRIGEINEASLYAKNSITKAFESNFPENIWQSAKTSKKIFQKQNKFKEALEMYELELKMRDSINNQVTQRAVVKKQMQYDFEKQEAIAKAEHKAELIKQQAVADEKNRRQNIVIGFVAAGLFLVIVFAVFVFRSLKITRKQKTLIEIKNKETEAQKHIIEEKQKEILDSIHYAKRIQTALITSEKYIEKNLNKLNA